MSDAAGDFPFLERIRGIRLEASRLGLSGPERFEYFQEELRKCSAADREAGEILLFEGHGSGVVQMTGEAVERDRAHTRERTTFWVSVAFLLIVLAVTLLVPHPTPSLAQILRLFMALGAAAFVASVPGLLSVEGKTKAFAFLDTFAIKATGGAAAFFLVYYYYPSALAK